MKQQIFGEKTVRSFWDFFPYKLQKFVRDTRVRLCRLFYSNPDNYGLHTYKIWTHVNKHWTEDSSQRPICFYCIGLQLDFKRMELNK